MAKAITVVLAVYVFVILDFFNVEEYSNVMSRDLSTRFFSYYYPRVPDDIVVVNTDKDSVDIWPPTYLDYTKWLEFITDFNPKAVVFDINFIKRRNDKNKEDFIEIIEDAKANGIKIYGINAKESDTDIAKSLIPVGTRWKNLEAGYYPIKSNDGILMASTRIFNDFYQPINESFTVPMFIKWPSRPPKEQLSFFGKLTSGFICLIVTCKSSSDETPYLDKFKAQDIFMNNENAQKYFSKRIVFFGSERKASKDFFDNPIYGRVPGVFIHAMALDNLIKYQENYYKRDDSKAIIIGLGSGSLIELFILFMNFYLFYRVQKWVDKVKVKNSKKALKVLKKIFKWSFICILIVMIGVMVSHLYLRNDPGNIIGLMASNLFIYELVYFLLLAILIKKPKPKKIKKRN